MMVGTLWRENKLFIVVYNAMYSGKRKRSVSLYHESCIKLSNTTRPCSIDASYVPL
jgi:hypothetical protein